MNAKVIKKRGDGKNSPTKNAKTHFDTRLNHVTPVGDVVKMIIGVLINSEQYTRSHSKVIIDRQ